MRCCDKSIITIIAFLILVSCSIQKPLMPIEVTYRKALLGEGLVASFHNSSQKHLAVVVILTNPTLNQTKSLRLDLSPDVTREIGHLEGWAFASGDIIEIKHNDYRTLTVKVP